MRDIREVTKSIINEIPKDKEDFRHSVKNISHSLDFAPPELEGMWWEELTMLVNSRIGIPTEEWQFKVYSVLANKTIDEIKELAENNVSKIKTQK